jgi:pimeloyl-ACP methyl ester carboxylesterase
MLMLLGYRAWRRRQVARALTITSPRGIVDEGFARIGGIEQWISIRGEDRDNPILVVVHGGPGAPYSIFTPRVRAWERHFTIVQWDQRGAGKTFRRNRATADDDKLTFDRLARDGLELVEHVCARLGHAKVILFGSSAPARSSAPPWSSSDPSASTPTSLPTSTSTCSAPRRWATR